MSPTPSSPRLELFYRAPHGWFRATLAREVAVLDVTMFGDGTDDGLCGLLEFLEDASAQLAPGELVQVHVDVSGLTWVPLRTPMALGRWILAHRHQLDQVEIVVGGALVRTATEAVFRIAGVHNLRVLDR